MKAIFDAHFSQDRLSLVRAVLSIATLVQVYDFIGIAERITPLTGLLFPATSYFNLPDPTALTGIFIAISVSAIGFALGWLPRLCGLTSSFLLLYLLLADQRLYSNHSYLLTLMTFLTALASSNDEATPYWPIFLAKMQISIMYFYAGITKINEGFLSGGIINATWTTEGPFALPQFLRSPEWLLWPAVGTIVLEVFLAFALWSKKLQPVAILLGIALHLSFPLVFVSAETLRLCVFSLVVWSGYLLFLSPPLEQLRQK